MILNLDLSQEGMAEALCFTLAYMAVVSVIIVLALGSYFDSNKKKSMNQRYRNYLKKCSKLKEPDFDLLIDDSHSQSVRVMTFDEFKTSSLVKRF